MRKAAATFAIAATTFILLATSAVPAGANNSWGGYHWARTANPFTLRVGDNVASNWDQYLNQTASDWTRSTVLDLTVVPGGSKSKNCQATAGRVEVCSGSYGNNGWLGIAQIWLARGTKHITQGTVRVNDFYFNLAQYNFTTEREHVMCQEVGHTLGLDHQSTDGSSQNTCMDYYRNTSDSDTTSTSPNQHDYDELGIIYQHPDSSTTISQSGAEPQHGNPHETVSSSQASDGSTLVTFILWT